MNTLYIHTCGRKHGQSYAKTSFRFARQIFVVFWTSLRQTTTRETYMYIVRASYLEELTTLVVPSLFTKIENVNNL